MSRSTPAFMADAPLFASESEFQTELVKVAKRIGYRAYHTHDSRRSDPGWPDLVLAHRRTQRVLFVEFKTDSGQLSDDQAFWCGILAAAGLEVYIWRFRDWDKALAILAERPGGKP